MARKKNWWSYQNFPRLEKGLDFFGCKSWVIWAPNKKGVLGIFPRNFSPGDMGIFWEKKTRAPPGPPPAPGAAPNPRLPPRRLARKPVAPQSDGVACPPLSRSPFAAPPGAPPGGPLFPGPPAPRPPAPPPSPCATASPPGGRAPGPPRGSGSAPCRPPGWPPRGPPPGPPPRPPGPPGFPPARPPWECWMRRSERES